MEKTTYILGTCPELKSYLQIFFQMLDDGLSSEEKTTQFVDFLEENTLMVVPEVMTVQVNDPVGITQEHLQSFVKVIGNSLKSREPLVLFHDDRISVSFQKVCEHLKDNITKEEGEPPNDGQE